MAKPRILVTRRWPAEVEQALGEAYEVTLNAADRPLGPDELTDAMRSFDALCPTVTDRIGPHLLEGLRPRIGLIANYGAGTDHIALEQAAAIGVRVSNTPDVLTDATADCALLLMLMVSRRAAEGECEVRKGSWQGWAPTHLLGQGLTGKTLGILGFGRIGQAVAQRGAALGMRILYHSTTPDTGATAATLGATYAETVEQLAEGSDVLSLHCRGGAATRHLVNAALLGRMRPNAILINTARGSVVHEADLVEALRNGTIAGAGLDVYEREPSVPAALLAAPNAVLLPHLGSATREARVAMGMRVKANLDAWFSGAPLPDRVA